MEMKTLLPPVTVNGVAIDPALIAAEAQNHPAPKGKPGFAWRAAARAARRGPTRVLIPLHAEGTARRKRARL